MDYEMIFDYHTHTLFSHGKGRVEDNVKVAVEKGLSEIAISDHGPGHLTYGVRWSRVPEMRKEIEEANNKYPIKVWMSVEANIVDKGNGLDISKDEIPAFDFILAGYHYGIRNGYMVRNWLDFHGVKNRKLIVKNTDMTINALYENDIRILTHPGDKGPFDLAEIAKACARTGTWMEISTHHPDLTVEGIEIAAKEDVKFVISSDAHIPRNVGEFKGGVERALKAGLDLDRIVNLRRI